MGLPGGTTTALHQAAFDRGSRARRRFIAMGFEPLREEIEDRHGLYIVRLMWKCACGRIEAIERSFIQIFVGELLAHCPRELNIYEHVERIGATTREHLEEDGFPEAFIAACEARAAEFDRGNA